MGLGLDLPRFIGQLVSFLLLVAVLSHFGYRPDPARHGGAFSEDSRQRRECRTRRGWR